MIYTITYPIITSDYSAIWQHELLYDPRHAVPTNNHWTLRMLFWLFGLGYNLLVPCGFLSWGKEEEELVTTWSSPLFSDSQFTTNGGIQSYCGGNVNFINCVSLTSQEHNYSEIKLLTRFNGSTSKPIFTIKNDLKKENSALKLMWVCVAFVFSFFNVSNTQVCARVSSSFAHTYMR